MVLPHFYLLVKIQVEVAKITLGMTPQQTNFIYKKGELGSFINKNMIKEELDMDVELDKMHDNKWR